MTDSTVPTTTPSGIHRSAIAVIAAAAIWAFGVIIVRADLVPIWDGRVYSDCIMAAASKLSAESLRCAGHASQAYVAVAAALQTLGPTSYLPLYLGNSLLIAAAVVAFHRIATRAFPAPELALDRAFLTAAFAVQPAMLGAALQPTLDLPLVPAFLWCIVFLLERRRLALVVIGLGLCFTKETGVLLYAILLGSHALWATFRRIDTLLERTKFLGVVALPLFVFAGYLLVRWLGTTTGSVVWNTSSTGDSILRQFLIPSIDLHLIKYLALLFVLSFAWVPTLTLVVDGFIGAVHAGHRLSARAVPGADLQVIGLLGLLTLAVTYGLTRFTTFGHIRYFLTVVPLLGLAMMGSLLRLRIPVVARRAWLGSYALALAASGVRTIDPVSRGLYGTFSFGSHEMLRMTRITGECCGYGQDQLAYSAQFTALTPLVDSAVALMEPAATFPIVVPDGTVWLFDAPPSGWVTQPPRVELQGFRAVGHEDLVNGSARPDSAYYLALPNGDNATAMSQLSRLYDFKDEHRFARGGYGLRSYRMALRRSDP